MNEAAKKASAITFALLVLLGVALAIMLAVNHIVEGNVMVRDVKDGEATVRRLFVHDIAHAGQYLPPADPKVRNTTNDLSRLPITYWHPDGPVGAALAKFDWFAGRRNTWHADARLPVSIVGHGWAPGLLPLGQLAAAWSEPPLAALPLKAGALAGYARPFQIVDFYEPNPAIHELSFPKSGEPKFTFVRDAQQRGAGGRVFQGNARTLLATEAPKRFYRVLFVDSVRGNLEDLAEDLLTREGLAALLATTADSGIVAYHVSNRLLKVAPVIAAAAAELKLIAVLAEDSNESGKGHYSSEWVFVARGGDHLRQLERAGGVHWSMLAARGQYLWTDAGKHDRTGLARRQD